MDTLVSRICGVQEQTVARWLPKVKGQISAMIAQKEKELARWPLSHPDLKSKRRHLQRVITRVITSFLDLWKAQAFREKDPQMNISARVRSTFARMRNSVRRALPRFMGPECEREIVKLLKETKSHGLPNFVSDAVFEHTLKEKVLPLLSTHARHLIKEVSDYMITVIGVLVQENSKEYASLSSEMELIARTCVEKQTEKAGIHTTQYCESEEMIFASDDERYGEILAELKHAVKQMGPWVAKELARELQKRENGGVEPDGSKKEESSKDKAKEPPKPVYGAAHNSNDKVNTVLETLSGWCFVCEIVKFWISRPISKASC